jgi:coproporphyrinogen III oxidase
MMEYKLTNRFRNVEDYISGLQKRICKGLEEADGTLFTYDKWDREEGGGGITGILQNGKLIEKGAVNISSVHGLLPDEAAAALKDCH